MAIEKIKILGAMGADYSFKVKNIEINFTDIHKLWIY